MQPEIKFILKLTRIRAYLRRHNLNKVDRSKTCKFLTEHINANKYTDPVNAKRFFLNHSKEIYSLIGVKGGKLDKEYQELYKNASEPTLF